MSADTLMAKRPTSSQGDRLGIIDCDVHPIVKGGMRSLYPYMPLSWQQRLKQKAAEVVTVAPLTLRFEHPNGSALRSDAKTPDGGLGGSDPDYIKSDLLDKHGIDIAILNCLQPGAMAAALAGPDESSVLCSAFNDFFLDNWKLTGSGPLRLAISVPVQSPEAGAAEIRRLAPNPAVAAVSLPLLNIRMGNRHYDPIYAEAHRCGLPILVHLTGADSIYHGAPQTAVGWPESYIERYVSFSQIAESNITSLIFSGTFEKFPGLSFLFVEYGFAWILPLLWRMDRTWRSLRHETPWVKKSPIDYVHENVRLATQPLDEPERAEDLHTLIKLFGYDLLMFSSDYPHWDNDMPEQSLRFMPDEARRMIFRENARKVLRL
jgi:predicted TIM-barrel fold metal-dependent hydrolase